MVQAVILAGGKGTRLASRLNGKPKPLIDVDGVPLLKRQLDVLIANGVDDIILLVNHAADQIDDFVNQSHFAANIRLIDDGDPRGTAGATLACLDLLDETFLVVYGDTLFDIDISHMLSLHNRAAADATLLLHPNDHPSDSDLVEIDASCRVTAFHAYPHPTDVHLRNLVNAAFYILNKKAITPWRAKMPVGDFGKDLFPAMVDAGATLLGYVSFEYIKDLGTPARLDKAETHLRRGVVERARRQHPQKAVFVDRDGTLNELRGYVRNPDELDVFPNAGEALRKLNDAEFRIVLVTNQPVLARGECDMMGLDSIHAKLESVLGTAGAYLDALYVCPHHPDRGFEGEVTELKRICACRKPGTGLIEAAVEAMNIDLSQSWVIGDSTADIAMANRLGIRSVLVETGEGGKDAKWQGTPSKTCADIGEAVNAILASVNMSKGVLH